MPYQKIIVLSQVRKPPGTQASYHVAMQVLNSSCMAWYNTILPSSFRSCSSRDLSYPGTHANYQYFLKTASLIRCLTPLYPNSGVS